MILGQYSLQNADYIHRIFHHIELRNAGETAESVSLVST